MKYEVNGKKYDVPDNEVDRLVDALEISISDACELWLADNGKIENDEQEALDNAQKGKRRYEKGAEARKKTTKERKIDYDKADLLEIIRNTLEITPDLAITGQKNEVELSFDYKNAEYTLKLTKHRPKK